MSKRSRLCVCGLIWATSWSAAPQVRADVPPPGFQECVGKAADEACELGVCRSQTCSRLDYEHWDRDSGMGPPSVQYACILCVGNAGRGGGGSGGAPHAGGSVSGGAGAAGEDAGPADDSGCGCTAGGGALGRHGAALGFALLMGILLAGRRRRSSR